MKSCTPGTLCCCRRLHRGSSLAAPIPTSIAKTVLLLLLLLLAGGSSPLQLVQGFASTAGAATQRRDLAFRCGAKKRVTSRLGRRTTLTRSTALAAVPFDPSSLLNDAAAAAVQTTMPAEARFHSNNTPLLSTIVDAFGSQLSSSVLLSSSPEAAAAPSLPALSYEGGDDPTAAVPTGMLSKQTAITVFVVGLVPWTVATFEFWRRIAVGASFGTSDPVVIIGEDDNPASSRGRRVLGRGALIAAYAIFSVVAVVLGLVVYSVLTTTATVPPATPPPPPTSSISLTTM